MDDQRCALNINRNSKFKTITSEICESDDKYVSFMKDIILFTYLLMYVKINYFHFQRWRRLTRTDCWNAE